MSTEDSQKRTEDSGRRKTQKGRTRMKRIIRLAV
jgi:hypothetical protein